MAIVDQKWSALPVPYALEVPDRVRKERSFDPDFLPRQQRGLHARGFEHLRLSEGVEGGVANFERTVDGFLAGLPYGKLLPALRAINVHPLGRPVVDLGI